MEKLEMETIDANFARAQIVINAIEEKRALLVDDLEEIYVKTGAIAFKTRDPAKAFKCVVWKLGVDNDGKIHEIGFNHTFKNYS